VTKIFIDDFKFILKNKVMSSMSSMSSCQQIFKKKNKIVDRINLEEFYSDMLIG